MKTIDIRSKSTEDLLAQLETLKDQLFSLKFQAATSQLENHRQIPQVKRSIAQVKTILREREVETTQA